MRKFDTLTSFINSKSSNPSADPVIEFEGYATKGDGGRAQWKHNGLTGQTPSQSPVQLNDALINDKSGNQYAYVAIAGTAKLEIQILALGAKFDGETTATDDTPVFRAALNSSAKVVQMPAGSTVWDTNGVSMESDQAVLGQGRARTFILVEPDANTIMFTATLAQGGFNSLLLDGFSVITSGSVIGQSILKTPQDALGFTDEHSFYVNDLYSLGSAQWTVAFDIGDSINGGITNVDIRGSYNTGIIDAGQPLTTAIKYGAVGSAVGFNISNFKISGYRTSFEIEENIEAFYITDGEATNSWRGIHSLPSVSKPGGVIDNVHLSANGAPIKIARRRNFNISNVQLYRATGTTFDHTEEWSGLLIDDCSRFNLTGIGIRHPDDLKSSSARIGVKIANSQVGSLAGLMTGYEDGLTTMLDLSIVGGISAEGMTCNTTTEHVVAVRGASSHINVGPVAYLGAAPAVPTFIETPDISIKISRDSAYIDKYKVEGVDSTTVDASYYAGISPLHTEIVDIEAATPYSTLFRLFNLNALFGDEFSFTVVIPATAHGSIFIRNEDSSVEQEFTGEGSHSTTWISNGTQWEVKSESRISASDIVSNKSVLDIVTTTGNHVDIGGSSIAENRFNLSGKESGGAPVISVTGVDTNTDMRFVPKGTGVIRFGTHTALAGETIDGHILIKDNTGVLRKIAILS